MNATARSMTSFDVHHVEVDEFLKELDKDYNAGVVKDSIVRLIVRDGDCPYSLLGETHPIRADDIAPYRWARRINVEAAYVARGELVKFSRTVGRAWGPDALTTKRLGISEAKAAEREAENAELKKAVSRMCHRLQAAFDKMTLLDVRGGALFVAEGLDWVAPPDQMIESPEPLACRWCAEPVYYANNSWRHVATRQAAVTREAPCDRCGGLGSLRSETGRYRLCPTCDGVKTVKVTDHVADVVELEEAPA